MKLAQVLLESKEERGLRIALEQPLLENVDIVPSTLSEEEQAVLSEGVATIIGAILAAPKVLEYIGRIVQWVVKIFRKLVGKPSPENEEGSNAVAEKIKHVAHKWHGMYVYVIKKIVKLSKFQQEFWAPDGKEDEEKLKLVAEVILNVAIAVAGIFAVYGAVTYAAKGKTMMTALELSLGSVKADELAVAVKKVGPKVAQYL